MSWFFFVDRATARLAAIVMSDGFGLPLAAKFAVKVANPSVDDYWQVVNAEFIQSYLSDEYELYEYDDESLDEDSNLVSSADTSDELEWEIPAVQQWVLGKALTRDEVNRVSHFLGIGSGSIAEEIIAGDLYRKTQGKPEPRSPRPKAPSARCLWCRVPIERRYNFNFDAVMTDQNFEVFDNPIIWSDGLVTESGERDAGDLFPNHYGDCVIACSACGATFLASSLEREQPRSHWYPDHENWHISHLTVLEGSCPEGANESQEQTVWVTLARRPQAMDFLVRAQSEGLINWEEWTALQQAVNWVTYEDRQAKLSGKPFYFEQEEQLKNAMRLFIERVGQIKAGTLGSMSPFVEMHRRETDDENFFVHNCAIQELLPVANMMRILGARDYGWASPRHPAVAEPAVRKTGWSEFDQLIALRGKLLLAAREEPLTDWAVAVDDSGNLVDWD